MKKAILLLLILVVLSNSTQAWEVLVSSEDTVAYYGQNLISPFQIGNNFVINISGKPFGLSIYQDAQKTPQHHLFFMFGYFYIALTATELSCCVAAFVFLLLVILLYWHLHKKTHHSEKFQSE